MKIGLLIAPGGRTLNSPHLGLGYLAAIIKEEGHEVSILDFTMEKTFKTRTGYTVDYSDPFLDQKILRKTQSFSFDILGFHVNVGNLEHSLSIADRLKKDQFPSKIVFGGPEATFFCNEILETCIPDIVVKGEGEETLREIINIRKINSDSLRNVRGISYLDNGIVRDNSTRRLVKNLDTLPFPAWEEFELSKYKINNRLILPATLSRGCRYDCVFCTARDLWRHVFRFRKIKPFVDELERDSEQFEATVFRFSDSTFNFNAKLTSQFCDEIIKRNLDIMWGSYARTDNLDQHLLREMFKAGCRYLYFGVESGSQRILDIMNKRSNVSQARRAIKLARKIGIKVLCSFMIGFPGETDTTIDQTIDFIKETQPDAVYVFAFENRLSDNFKILEKGYMVRSRYTDTSDRHPTLIREMHTRILPRPFVPWQDVNLFFNWEETVTKLTEIETVVRSIGANRGELELMKSVLHEE